LDEIEHLLLCLFLALPIGSSSKARVESLEFEEALNCVSAGLTFFGLVDVLLDVYNSRVLGSERRR
jgi:hypothetical protein